MGRILCLLLSFSALVFTADQDPEFTPDAVTVEGLPLLPLAKLAADSGSLEVHPKGMVAAGWDSNPLGSTEPDGDAFVRAMLGCELRAQGSDGWRADVDAKLTAKEYASVDADQLGGSGRATATRTGKQGTTMISGYWSLDDEPIQPEPGGVLVKDWGASAGTSWEERRWEAAANLAFSKRDYLEDGPDFGEDDRDLSLWRLTASWYSLAAESSKLGIEAGLEDGQRPESQTQNDWRGASAAGRWRHIVGERSHLDVRLGAVLRDYSRPTRGDPGNDDDLVAMPLVDLLFTNAWQDRNRATVALTLGPGDPVSPDANAAQRVLLQAWLRVRLADRLEWVNYAASINSRDTGAVIDGEIATQRYLELETSIEYRLRQGIALRPLVSWRRNDTSPGDLTTRIIAGVAAMAAF